MRAIARRKVVNGVVQETYAHSAERQERLRVGYHLDMRIAYGAVPKTDVELRHFIALPAAVQRAWGWARRL